MPDEHKYRPTASVDERDEAHRLRQMASEMILADSSLTDELTDHEAQPLIGWGVIQAKAAADELARAGQDTLDSWGRGQGEALAGLVDPVRKMMARINRLVAQRHILPADELLGELQRLFALAENLSCSPLSEVPAESLAGLTTRQTDLDGRAFVQAIVGLLGDCRSAGLDAAQEPSVGK